MAASNTACCHVLGLVTALIPAAVGCYNPSFNGTLCGDGNTCPDGYTCNLSTHVCESGPGAADAALSDAVPAVCGDGTKEGTEECDDHNLAPGDGCSDSCTVEPNWICSGDHPSTCEFAFFWATWPMPDSPTVFCTDGSTEVSCPSSGQTGYGQDGNYQLLVPSYDTSTTGVVVDSVTALMWQRDLPGSTYNWASAVAYCDSLVLATFDDWRLPSRIELVSLVDYGRFGPALDTTAFPGVAGVYFWTSSVVAASTDEAWGVDFDTGFVQPKDTGTSFEVRCVR